MYTPHATDEAEPGPKLPSASVATLSPRPTVPETYMFNTIPLPLMILALLPDVASVSATPIRETTSAPAMLSTSHLRPSVQHVHQ